MSEGEDDGLQQLDDDGEFATTPNASRPAEAPDASDRTRLFHVAGAEPFMLRLVEIDEVLSRGGHRPLRCRLEHADGEPAGDWVVKPPISLGDAESREELSVLAELAGAEVCAWADMPTPAVGLLKMPDAIHPEHLAGLDPLARDQVKANAGRLAFCSRFLEDAVEWTPNRHQQNQRGRDLARAYGPELMFLDAFMLHDDRTVEKPNCLEHGGRIVPIDHGNAFAGFDTQGAGAAEFVAPAKVAVYWTHHAFHQPLRRTRKALREPEAIGRLTSVPEPDVRVLGQRWPAGLRIAKTRSGHDIVSEMVELLVRRGVHSGAIWRLLLQFLGKSDG